MRVVEKLGIPVATGADSIDCIYDEHPLYVGKGGNVRGQGRQLCNSEQLTCSYLWAAV